MAKDWLDFESAEGLRLRALQRLTGDTCAQEARLNASAAFQVLHDLASSPATGAAALTLLHELQVYQVELDMQEEELQRTRAELEASLQRQVQLYDFAPVGCLTVDAIGVIRELNLTAATMLGAGRDQLPGRSLDAFLMPHAARAMRAMLASLRDGALTVVDTLELAAQCGPTRRVHASANRDPGGRHFMIALIDIPRSSGAAI